MFNYKIRHVNFQIAVLSKTDAGFLKMIKLKEFRVFKNQSLLRAQLENCSLRFLPTSLNCHKWECPLSWLPLPDCQRVRLANRSSFANWTPPPDAVGWQLSRLHRDAGLWCHNCRKATLRVLLRTGPPCQGCHLSDEFQRDWSRWLDYILIKQLPPQPVGAPSLAVFKKRSFFLAMIRVSFWSKGLD